MLFSFSDLPTNFTAEHLAQGLELFLEDRVTSPNLNRGGELVTAVIHEHSDKPVRVYIQVRKQGPGATIKGECTCRQGGNCQHVAAVLLQTLDDNQALPAGATLARKATRLQSVDATPPPGQEQAAAVTSATDQVLLYRLKIAPANGQLMVEPMAARQLKNGGYASIQPFAPASLGRSTPPRFLTAADIEILKRLKTMPVEAALGVSILAGPRSAEILEAMAASGRSYLADQPRFAVTLGAVRTLRHQWQINRAGDQQLAWNIKPAAQHLLSYAPPWYLDARARCVGPLSSDLPVAVLARLQALSPVAPEHIQQTRALLQQEFPHLVLPTLQPVEVAAAMPAVTPVPVLRLLTLRPELTESNLDAYDMAWLSFDYGGVKVRRHEGERIFDGTKLQHIPRDSAAEHRAVRQLLSLGLEEAGNWCNDTGEDCFCAGAAGIDSWIAVQLAALASLPGAGWRIDINADFRHTLVQAQHWYCDAQSLREQNWFSIGMGIVVNGQRLDMLGALSRYLETFPEGVPQHVSEDSIAVALEDGRFAAVPTPWLRALLDTLLELYKAKSVDHNQRLRLSRVQLSRFTALAPELAHNTLDWSGDVEAMQLAEQLRNVDRVPAVAVPVSLQAELRPYQQRGLDWLQFLRSYRLAGILADDMGLGKTLQLLAHLLLEKEQGRLDMPCLIVVPTSLLGNWRREAQRFTPALRVLTLWGGNRHQLFARIPHYDLVLTTYPLLTRDTDTLLGLSYYYVVLDEAQVIKNAKTQASEVVRRIDARYRLCLTGTPMENHLGELWSLYDFLLPGLLGSSDQFRRFFRTPIEKHGNASRRQRLHNRVRPFLLRRSKTQVATELPPKTEIIQTVTLAGQQRELYETVRLAMQVRVRREIERQGLGRSHIVVLDALLKLRQVCCDPRLVKLDTAHQVTESAKLDSLMTLIPEMIEEGRRILVFSQFTSMLDLIGDTLQRAAIDYLQLTGNTRHRDQVVQRFQQGEVPLFLVSLKAGGVGLNLTAADTVIHYDPWWNPAVARQATDRAHRIGQQQAVFEYKMICEGTVEEKIQVMQQDKQALADSVFEKEGNSEPRLSEQDLEQLFSPLEG